MNPTQFGRGEDFDRYPRDEARDLRLLEKAGVAVVFAPTADEMYPEGFATSVHVGGPLTESLEGASRPSHFDGVAVIVTKLLDVVQPDVLFLGEKDAQQLAVVRRFVRDLDLPVEVAGVPTVREPDGLAMSSRNVYLTPEQRAVAPDLYRALLAGAAAAGAPGAAAKDVVAAATSALLLPDGRPRPRRRRRGALPPALRARLPRRRRRRHLRPRGRPRAALAAHRRGPSRLHPSHRHHLRTQRVPRQGRDRMKGRTTMATVFVNGTQKDHVREGLVRVITGSIEFASHGDADMIKITDEVTEAVRQTGLSDGTVTLFVPGATGALTTLEYEPGVVEDVQKALDVVAPADQFYQHNVNLGDGNGHSHVRAGLVGPSLVVPFVDGRLTLGRYQNIVFCDFDARPRERVRRGAGDGRMSAADAQGGAPAAACDPSKERPLVQVALDFVDLPRALEVAREAVAGGADWVEAGTPLIKAEGLNAVRALKAEFPEQDHRRRHEDDGRRPHRGGVRGQGRRRRGRRARRRVRQHRSRSAPRRRATTAASSSST